MGFKWYIDSWVSLCLTKYKILLIWQDDILKHFNSESYLFLSFKSLWNIPSVVLVLSKCFVFNNTSETTNPTLQPSSLGRYSVERTNPVQLRI